MKLICTIVLAAVATATALDRRGPALIRIQIKGSVTDHNTPNARDAAAQGVLKWCQDRGGNDVENEIQSNGEFTYICDCGYATTPLPANVISSDDSWTAVATYFGPCN
ncbi:hypothetical protein E4U55_005330 [Claviceps digitariae]|nr:hypothetical protein E4U55_005330 [Claviceps digitariae]